MSQTPDLSLFRFKHTLRVRWAEVDPQEVVFNGNYLTYFDVAFTEYFRALGITYPEGLTQYGCDWYVRKSTIEFQAPARFDQLLDVYVRLARLGNTSATIQLEIMHEAHHLISGEMIYVNVDVNTQQPMRLPDALRTVFEKYEVSID